MACPPAHLQVVFSELLSSVELASVRHHNYVYWRSRNGQQWCVWGRVG